MSIFHWGKGGWGVGHHVPIVMKSGSLSQPESSASVQACTGIAENIYTYILYIYIMYVYMYVYTSYIIYTIYIYIYNAV